MFSRIRAAAHRITQSPEARAAHAAVALGLPIIDPTPETTAQKNVAQAGVEMMAQGGLEAFRESWLDCYASKDVILNGTRRYAALEGAIDLIVDCDIDEPADAERKLPPFETAWLASDCDSFVGGVYARLLFATGYAWRGTGWAHEVSEEGWRQHKSYTTQAHDVLRDSYREDCPFWHRTLFSVGLSDGSSREELQRRFEAALAFDRYDIDLYLERAYQLQPRWHGSFEELDAFARETMFRTQDALGTSLYARIYACQTDFEYITDTKAEWQLLKEGFEDWIALTQVDFASNAFAAAAALQEDWSTVDHVFRNHITAYVPCAWDYPELAAEVMERAK